MEYGNDQDMDQRGPAAIFAMTQADDRRKSAFRLGLAAAVCVGAALRLWGWPDQQLLDDEWHALNFVIGKSLVDVFITQGNGANSVPVNLWSWLLLHTVGWSEWLLRLPSTVCGIAAVLVLPLLVMRLWGRAVGLTMAVILALAPATIFYARNARPYAPAMLLAAVSVFATLLWLGDKRRRDVITAALCGTLAISYHLYAVIPVGGTFAAVLAVAFLRRFNIIRTDAPPVSDVVIAAAIMAVGGSVLVVLPNVLNPWWTAHDLFGYERADVDTVLTVVGLFAGSTTPALQWIFTGLAAAGLARLVVADRPAGLALTFPFVLFAIVVFLNTQDGSSAGIQAARYGIAFFPIGYALVALAVVGGARRALSRLPGRRRAPAAAVGAVVLLAPFIATSPLWTTYAGINNFTGHSAYQYRYAPIDWNLSPERDLAPGYRMRRRDVSPLYFDRAFLNQMAGVIEYPMFIGDHFNVLYFCQHFHGRPVRAGYVSQATFRELPSRDDCVYGNLPVDYVLSRVPPTLRANCNLTTLVDLTDIERLRHDYRGWLVIVHFNPLSESFPSIFDADYPEFPLANPVARLMEKVFGQPVAREERLSAWLVD